MKFSKAAKKSQFDKQPDFGKVVEKVSLKQDVQISEGLKNNIEICFKDYQQQSHKNRSLTSMSWKLEEND